MVAEGQSENSSEFRATLTWQPVLALSLSGTVRLQSKSLPPLPVGGHGGTDLPDAGASQISSCASVQSALRIVNSVNSHSHPRE